MGVSPGIATEFWEWPSRDFCSDLNNYTNALLDATEPPLVNSISYGWQGELSKIGCSDADVQVLAVPLVATAHSCALACVATDALTIRAPLQVVDASWAKLAARGITILISSGDSGSGAASGGDCSDKKAFKKGEVVTKGILLGNETVPPDPFFCCGHCKTLGCKTWTFSPYNKIGNLGTCSFYANITEHEPTKDPKKDQFYSGGEGIMPPAPTTCYASWPASSPWVTAVGATRFIGQRVGGVEMATDQFGSGGGFSRMFDQTDAQWQAAATAAYLKKGGMLPKFPPKGSFAPNGRGTPDVSALGEGYQVYVSGSVKSVGGTSASAPAFAGLISLINEARFSAGKQQMGFLNPFLYQHPEAFFDVVNGTNAIGRGTGPLDYGFAAAAGWDAATGLGTPHFDKLLAAAMKA